MDELLSLPFFDIFIVILLGAVLGSFATAIAHRSASEESWAAQLGINARSCCTSCEAQLGLRDLVPILSWLTLRGKCRQCDTAISWHYPAIEIASIGLCLGVFAVHGLTLSSVLMMAAVPFLLALLVVDLRHMILPDVLVVLFALLGLASVCIGGNAADVFSATLSAIIYGGLLWGFGWGTAKILSKESLGFGDVKFFAASGLWLGLSAIGNMMILSGLLGLVFAIGWRAIKKEDYFPFGPALICATYILFLING